MNTRTHVVIPKDLVAEIDVLVGKRGRSMFITNAAEKELLRLRQSTALKAAAGAWSKAHHPELENGVEAYVRELRRESEIRFKKQQAG